MENNPAMFSFSSTDELCYDALCGCMEQWDRIEINMT
jgi:hypothetical protein